MKTRSAKKLTIIITAAALAAVIVIGIVAAGAVFNRELAALDVLEKRGLTKERADEVLSLFGYFYFTDALKEPQKLYRAISALNIPGGEGLAEAVGAYFSPEAVENPFVIFKYIGMKNLDALKNKDQSVSVSLSGEGLVLVLEEGVVLEIGEGVVLDVRNLSLSPAEAEALAREVGRLAEGVSVAGEEELSDFCSVLLKMTGEGSGKVSIKDAGRAYEYFVRVTKDNDFRNFYILDLLFGENFTENSAAALLSLKAALEYFDLTRLNDLFIYLPSVTKFFIAFSRELLTVPGIDIDELSEFSATVINTLAPQNAGFDLTAEYIAGEIRFAGSLDPDDLSDEEFERAALASEKIFSFISVSEENAAS